MTVAVSFSETTFRALFPAFANSLAYPTAALELYWASATAYVSDQDAGAYVGAMTVAQQALALNQMTAHLVALNDMIASGNTPGVTTGATVDKVSVTIEPPPTKSLWQYWLALTPYGQQLLALLQVASVGGSYYGGFPVVGAFRR